jgi:hypothetical protein
VVYDTTSRVAHALTAEAASVWGRCDGMRSLAEIARDLGMEADWVDSAIFELERCGLLEAPLQAPLRFSRREAGGAVVCTGTACCKVNEGCNSTDATCRAGVACCTVPVGGGFACPQ